MFIELTDHLRCPVEHEEQYLVLLPEVMDGRRVVSGDLGCPVCGRVVRVDQGIADFGDAAPAAGESSLTAEALAAFLGISGPGGYVALAGGLTALAPGLALLLPGVRLVLVNPEINALDSESGSVLRAGRLPLKSSSMRGVAVGADLAAQASWVDDAARAVLPGLRLVAEGGTPPAEGVEVLGLAGGVWVAKKR
jgi:hypothetical protein